jgi:hypothetical protein
MATQTLHGACACGRNRYVVEMPSQELQLAELLYDNTSASRMSFPIVTEPTCTSPRSRHASRIPAMLPLESV